MNTPLVLIDEKNKLLVRMHNGIATDILKFEEGHLFYTSEIEQLRKSPRAFIEGIAQ
jgi:hypothetical protein